MGEHDAGDLKRESAEARAERSITQELKRTGATGTEWMLRRKTDPVRLALAAWFRREPKPPRQACLRPPAVSIRQGL